MARTKQTARKSVGGKSVRGKGGKGLGKGSGAPSSSSPTPQPMASFTNKRKRGYAPGSQAALLAEDDQPPFTSPPEITFTGTHDTAFYAHYFTTGEREKDQEVRCHYAVAHTRDPLTQTEDCWMSVSYNSKYDGVGMKLNAPDGRQSNRPALNLVVALDISGSMGSSFHGDEENDDDEGAVPKKKLQVAKECLLALIGQLQDDDAFGLVIFNSKASVLQPLAKWSSVDKIALEKAINKLRANGGTDLTVAFKAATKLYAQAEEGPHRSNRVFFLTDMEAGSGEDERTFIETVKRNSEVSLWSTIVGIGMDLARETVEETSKTPGCNYATVVSSQDFREMINHEFDYTVTPIGFNVSLGLESDVWQLHSGYGSPEVSCLQPGGQVRHSTLFPSTQNAEGESRSGLFLFKIDRKEAVTDRGLDSAFSVVSKWDNLMGLEQTDVQQLQFKEGHVDNLGIRKAVLLVYYTDFIRPYLAVRNQALGLPSAASPVAAPMPTRYLPLITPENRFSLLTQFIDFFKREMEAVRDSSLSDELSFLETVYDVEHPLFSAPLTAAVEKKNEDDSLVESKGKHVDNDIEDNDDEDYDDEEDAVKRRKMEEDDEKLARQLAAMEEENQEELQQVVADSQQPMASDGDETTNNQCVVCWAEQKSVLFQPCRHMCTCKSCADKTPTCPLCRSDISQRTDVFV